MPSQALRSSTPLPGSDKLVEIVSDADQRPFCGGFIDAARSKSSRLFDLAENRFGNLFAQAVPATVASTPQLGSHSLHKRTTLWFDSRTDGMGGVANGQIGADV